MALLLAPVMGLATCVVAEFVDEGTYKFVDERTTEFGDPPGNFLPADRGRILPWELDITDPSGAARALEGVRVVFAGAEPSGAKMCGTPCSRVSLLFSPGPVLESLSSLVSKRSRWFA